MSVINNCNNYKIAKTEADKIDIEIIELLKEKRALQ